MTMPEVNVEFLQKVVTLAESASKLEKSASVLKESAPKAIDALIKAGLVLPSSRDTWISKLSSDPSAWLVLLQKTAGYVRPRSMGAGEGEGAPKTTSTEKPSDRFFAEKFGKR